MLRAVGIRALLPSVLTVFSAETIATFRRTQRFAYGLVDGVEIDGFPVKLAPNPSVHRFMVLVMGVMPCFKKAGIA